jgi:hypothetical protein
MTQLLMVDRATPPSDAEIAQLDSLGVGACAVYIGGETEAPSATAWDGFDLGKLSRYRLLPIFVGQNLPWTTDESATRGAADAAALLDIATRRGFSAGPVCDDIEFQTYQDDPVGTSTYWRAFASRIAAAGRRAVGYQPLPMAQAYAGAGFGAWVSWWPSLPAGIPDLSQLPVDASRYAGLGWQFSDWFHGWDASVVDGRWWDMTESAPAVISGFATGFSIGGGIAQAWQHNGGVYAFGQPISREYDTVLGGQPIRLQWFERGIASWIGGQYPAEWDVEWLLLGDALRDTSDLLAQLTQSRRDNPTAFVP